MYGEIKMSFGLFIRHDVLLNIMRTLMATEPIDATSRSFVK